MSWSAPVFASTVVLNFNDLNPLNVGGPLFIPSPYSNSGFSLSSTLGFDTYGTSLTGFFAGQKSLAPILGSAIQLNATGNSPFTLLSIDLARNFDFDPAPTVTFTGVLQAGGTVTESFTVTTPAGDAAFQTFDLTGFVNVVAVDWTQATNASEGAHQFTNIGIQEGASAVPEPGTLLLVFSGLGVVLAQARRKSPDPERQPG
jgi:VCBS repeat-containing protein